MTGFASSSSRRWMRRVTLIASGIAAGTALLVGTLIAAVDHSAAASTSNSGNSGNSTGTGSDNSQFSNNGFGDDNGGEGLSQGDQNSVPQGGSHGS